MDGHLSTHTEYYEELYLLLYESANRIKWIRRVVVSPNSATNAARVVGTARNYNFSSSERFMNTPSAMRVTIRDMICYCGTLDYGSLLQ